MSRIVLSIIISPRVIAGRFYVCGNIPVYHWGDRGVRGLLTGVFSDGSKAMFGMDAQNNLVKKENLSFF